jgi:hypothetical protein
MSLELEVGPESNCKELVVEVWDSNIVGEDECVCRCTVDLTANIEGARRKYQTGKKATYAMVPEGKLQMSMVAEISEYVAVRVCKGIAHRAGVGAGGAGDISAHGLKLEKAEWRKGAASSDSMSSTVFGGGAIEGFEGSEIGAVVLGVAAQSTSGSNNGGDEAGEDQEDDPPLQMADRIMAIEGEYVETAPFAAIERKLNEAQLGTRTLLLVKRMLGLQCALQAIFRAGFDLEQAHLSDAAGKPLLGELGASGSLSARAGIAGRRASSRISITQLSAATIGEVVPDRRCAEDGYQKSPSHQEEIQQRLEVEVCCARGLRNTQYFSEQNPLVSIALHIKESGSSHPPVLSQGPLASPSRRSSSIGGGIGGGGIGGGGGGRVSITAAAVSRLSNVFTAVDSPGLVVAIDSPGGPQADTTGGGARVSETQQTAACEGGGVDPKWTEAHDNRLSFDLTQYIDLHMDGSQEEDGEDEEGLEAELLVQVIHQGQFIVDNDLIGEGMVSVAYLQEAAAGGRRVWVTLDTGGAVQLRLIRLRSSTTPTAKAMVQPTFQSTTPTTPVSAGVDVSAAAATANYGTTVVRLDVARAIGLHNPTDDDSAGSSDPMGTFSFASMGIAMAMDPYVTVHFGGRSASTLPVASGGTDPRWEERHQPRLEFDFAELDFGPSAFHTSSKSSSGADSVSSVDNIAAAAAAARNPTELIVEVWDSNVASADEFVGRCVLPMLHLELLPGHVQTDTAEIVAKAAPGEENRDWKIMQKNFGIPRKYELGRSKHDAGADIGDTDKGKVVSAGKLELTVRVETREEFSSVLRKEPQGFGLVMQQLAFPVTEQAMGATVTAFTDSKPGKAYRASGELVCGDRLVSLDGKHVSTAPFVDIFYALKNASIGTALNARWQRTVGCDTMAGVAQCIQAQVAIARAEQDGAGASFLEPIMAGMCGAPGAGVGAIATGAATAKSSCSFVSIRDWLLTVNPELAAYADALSSRGYPDTRALADSEVETLVETMADLGMIAEQQQQVLKAFARVRYEAAELEATAVEEVEEAEAQAQKTALAAVEAESRANIAATRLQALTRGKARTKSLMLKKDAAAKVQSIFRGRVGADLREGYSQPFTTGLLSSLGFGERQEKTDMQTAAIEEAAVQAAEAEAGVAVELAKEAEENAKIAATKLQAIQRGNTRKQSMMAKKGAALKLQAMVRGRLNGIAEAPGSEDPEAEAEANEEAEAQAEAEAEAEVEKIESKAEEAVAEAAQGLEAAAVRSAEAEAKAAIAATRLQAIQRGKARKQSMMLKKGAAQKMQSLFRSTIDGSAEVPEDGDECRDRAIAAAEAAANHAEELGVKAAEAEAKAKIAATKLQAIQRGKTRKQSMMAKKGAALKLQAMVRGHHQTIMQAQEGALVLGMSMLGLGIESPRSAVNNTFNLHQQDEKMADSEGDEAQENAFAELEEAEREAEDVGVKAAEAEAKAAIAATKLQALTRGKARKQSLMMKKDAVAKVQAILRRRNTGQQDANDASDDTVVETVDKQEETDSDLHLGAEKAEKDAELAAVKAAEAEAKAKIAATRLQAMQRGKARKQSMMAKKGAALKLQTMARNKNVAELAAPSSTMFGGSPAPLALMFAMGPTETDGEAAAGDINTQQTEDGLEEPELEEDEAEDETASEVVLQRAITDAMLAEAETAAEEAEEAEAKAATASVQLRTAVVDEMADAIVNAEQQDRGKQAFEQACTPSTKVEFDSDAVQCQSCSTEFSFFTYSYNCETCGRCFCSDCTKRVASKPDDETENDFFSSESSTSTVMCNSCYRDARRSVRFSCAVPANNGSVSPLNDTQMAEDLKQGAREEVEDDEDDEDDEVDEVDEEEEKALADVEAAEREAAAMAVAEAKADAKAKIAATKLQALQRGKARKQSMMVKKEAAQKVQSLVRVALFKTAEEEEVVTSRHDAVAEKLDDEGSDTRSTTRSPTPPPSGIALSEDTVVEVS